LGTNLAATSPLGYDDYIPLSAYSNFPNNILLRIDNELVTAGVQLSPGQWRVFRAQNGTSLAAHTNGTIAYLTGSSYLNQAGSNVIFMNFEITATTLTNRNIDDGSANTMPGGLQIAGTGNSAFGLVIHNVGEPGIGWSSGANPVELDGCIFWGNGMYDPIGMLLSSTPSGSVTASQSGSIVTTSTNFFTAQDVGQIINFDNGTNSAVGIDGYIDPSDVLVSAPQTVSAQGFTMGWYVRGSPVYGAGDGNLMKNCISFRNFTTAGKFFTSSVIVNDSSFVGNIGFMNPYGSFEMGSGNGPMTNCAWQSNYMFLESPMIGWNFDGDTNFSVIGNTIIGGCITLTGVASAVVSSNRVFQGPATTSMNLTTRTTPWTNVNILWNSNTYYSSMSDLPTYGFTLNLWDRPNTTNSYGGGRLLLSDWQHYSGFDSNSTYTANWPTNYLNVSVCRLDYDTNRFHICVVSTSGQTNEPLTLSSNGFSPGDNYALYDAQNYFTAVASGTYNGGTINLPLNLTNVSAIPGVGHFTNQHSNVQNPGFFNAFVLVRTPAPAPPTSLHIISP
jgi:hypothetical protein